MKVVQESPLFRCKLNLLVIMQLLDNRDLLSLLTTCKYFLRDGDNRDVYDHAMRVRLQFSNVFGIPFGKLLKEIDAEKRQKLFDLSIDCSPQPFNNEGLPELHKKLVRLLRAMELIKIEHIVEQPLQVLPLSVAEKKEAEERIILALLKTFAEQPLQVLQPLVTEVAAFDKTTVLSLRYPDHVFKRADLNWHLLLVILLQMAELYTKTDVLAPEYDVVVQLCIKLSRWLASEELEIKYIGHLRDLLERFNYFDIPRESLWSGADIAALLPLHNMLLVNAPAKSDAHETLLRKINQMALDMGLPMQNSLPHFAEIEKCCIAMCKLAPDADLGSVFQSPLAQYDIAWHILICLAVFEMCEQTTAIPDNVVSAVAAMVAMAVHRGSSLDEKGTLGNFIFKALPIGQRILFTEKFSACLGIKNDDASARYITDDFSTLIINRIALLRTLFGKNIFDQLQEVNIIPVLNRERLLRRDGNLEELPENYHPNINYRITDLIRFKELANIQRMHRFLQWKMYFFFATAAAQFNLPLRAALDNCADLLVRQPVVEFLISPERIVADCFLALGMTLPAELQGLRRTQRNLFFAAPAAPGILGIPPQQAATNHDIFSDDEEVMLGASSGDDEPWDADPQMQLFEDDGSSDGEVNEDDNPNDDDIVTTPPAAPSRKRANASNDIRDAKSRTLVSSDDDDSAGPRSSSTAATSSSVGSDSDDVDVAEPTENSDEVETSRFHTP